MNKPRKGHRESRRPDSGTITIIAVALLTALMGMAALAVDLGFLYTRSRMMYAVADAAVAIGMKDLMAGASNATINTDVATNYAGQYGGAYSITCTPAANQVQVTVTHTYPLYFAKMLGFSSKQLTVTAIGTRSPSPPPILALGSGCGGGVTFNGEGAINVHGDVESNGFLHFSTGSPGPNIMGNALAGCGPVTKNPWDTVTGTLGAGSGFTDPFSPYVVPTCDYGSMTTAYTLPSWGPPWDMTTTPWTLPAGVYCSNGTLQLNDPGAGFNALGVTLISAGGIVQIQINKASTITPNAASPNGVVAFSATSDVTVNGPAGQPLIIGGALYAPNGTVNLQQNGPLTIGALIGSSVSISDYSPWDIGGGGGASSSWQMSQ
jgi:hypothetical protein